MFNKITLFFFVYDIKLAHKLHITLTNGLNGMCFCSNFEHPSVCTNTRTSYHKLARKQLYARTGNDKDLNEIKYQMHYLYFLIKQDPHGYRHTARIELLWNWCRLLTGVIVLAFYVSQIND